MKADGVPLHRVAAVSGSGQQHGSVYLRREAAGLLGKLSPHASLSEQLAPALATPDSPIWMDSSTSAECRQLEAAVGGAQALASLTGSRAYERFTAHQILRLAKTQPDTYAATDRVCLVRCSVRIVTAGKEGRPSLCVGGSAGRLRACMQPSVQGRGRHIGSESPAVQPSKCPTIVLSAATGAPPSSVHLHHTRRRAAVPAICLLTCAHSHPLSTLRRHALQQPRSPPLPALASPPILPALQISSFLASVLRGGYAPIDLADGSGMNALDIERRDWAAPVLAALEAAGAAGVGGKLGAPSPSHTPLGPIAPYFTARYGFSPDCETVAWSGDNPCSVAGLGLREPGDVAVSLGTSDTIFGLLSAPSPGVDGHVFVNPVDPASYMAMLVYKSGSLTRERVRDSAAGGSWETFNRLLGEGGAGAAGNGGRFGLFLDAPEITPTTAAGGDYRYSCALDGTTAATGAGAGTTGSSGGAAPKATPLPAFSSPAQEVRAVVEGKFMSMRLHAEGIGLSPVRRIIATGGASKNAAILQVLADVFGAPVLTGQQADSASLGAAYRAAHAYASKRAGRLVPFAEVLAGGVEGAGSEVPALVQAAAPRPGAHAAYTAALPAFAACEAATVAAAAAAAAKA